MKSVLHHVFLYRANRQAEKEKAQRLLSKSASLSKKNVSILSNLISSLSSDIEHIDSVINLLEKLPIESEAFVMVLDGRYYKGYKNLKCIFTDSIEDAKFFNKTDLKKAYKARKRIYRQKSRLPVDKYIFI